MNLYIDWVIVGGEGGRKARPMNESWVWDIKQRDNQGAAFSLSNGVEKIKRKMVGNLVVQLIMLWLIYK